MIQKIMMSKVESMRQLAFELHIPLDKTFSNYWIDTQNAVCATYIQQLISNHQLENSYIYGEKNTGKTHLLQAAVHLAHVKGVSPVYLTGDFLLRYKPELLKDFHGTSFLCLDDLHLLAGRREWEIALFNLWNAALEKKNQLIFSSRFSPKESSFQLPDLISRLTQMTIFHLQPLGDKDKKSVLQAYSKLRGHEIPEPIIDYLFNHCERDLGSLLQAVDQLNQTSLENKKQLSVAQVRKILSEKEGLA